MIKSILEFTKLCILIILGTCIVIAIYPFITGDESKIKNIFKEKSTVDMKLEEFQEMCTSVKGQVIEYSENMAYSSNEFPLIRYKCVTKSNIYFLKNA